MKNRIFITILFTSAAVATSGCEENEDYDGIYVRCKPDGLNYHVGWTPGPCPGNLCPEAKYHDRTPCFGQSEWLASGGDTGGAAENEGIDRHNWPTHEPSITYIRNRCTDMCNDATVEWNPHTNQPMPPPECDPENWQLQNKAGQVGSLIQNPGELTCYTPQSDNKAGSNPAGTDVIPAGTTPRWQSDGAYISLACGDYLDCAGEFKQNLMRFLSPSNPSDLPRDDASEADYLATSSATSSSLLTLTVDNSGTPSSDSDWVAGRIEYTALDCGLATCPFFLGNLVLTNDADTWDLWSADFNADVDVTDIDARLRWPALGVWRPATGEVYLPAEMLDFQVRADVKIGSWTPFPVTRVATNASNVFGELSSTGAIELSGLELTDGELTAAADVEWDSVDGEPPVASISVASTVSIPPGHAGYPITSITNNSSDPDNDLTYTLWFVDGEQVADTYAIPSGSHTVRISVFDGRFAFDTAEVSLTVNP
jgi:hypothetical protein